MDVTSNSHQHPHFYARSQSIDIKENRVNRKIKMDEVRVQIVIYYWYPSLVAVMCQETYQWANKGREEKCFQLANIYVNNTGFTLKYSSFKCFMRNEKWTDPLNSARLLTLHKKSSCICICQLFPSLQSSLHQRVTQNVYLMKTNWLKCTFQSWLRYYKIFVFYRAAKNHLYLSSPTLLLWTFYL